MRRLVCAEHKKPVEQMFRHYYYVGLMVTADAIINRAVHHLYYHNLVHTSLNIYWAFGVSIPTRLPFSDTLTPFPWLSASIETTRFD